MVISVFRFTCFPENEISNGVFFILIGISSFVLSLAEIKLAGVEVGKFSVVREGGNAEIDGAVIGGVGMAFFDQLLDHLDLLWDMCKGAGLDVGGEAAEGDAVDVKLFRPASCKFLECLSRCLSITDRLVVDVSDISNMECLHVISFKHATEHVLHHKGAKVSNMCRAVNSGPTAVETEGLAIDWLKLALLAGEGVEEVHWLIG